MLAMLIPIVHCVGCVGLDQDFQPSTEQKRIDINIIYIAQFQINTCSLVFEE